MGELREMPPIGERPEQPSPEEREVMWQIVKDERDANGNGYVEVFTEAAPIKTDGETHHYKIGYQVTDKPGGTPGKRWEKVNEEDLGPVPRTETIH